MGRASGQRHAVGGDQFAAVLGTRRGSGRPLTKRTDATVRPYTLAQNPNAIARTVAAQHWPGVQKQRRLAPGVFGFTCAGHGGIVAVIGKADLDPAHVAAARDAGLTDLVVTINNKTYSTAAGYNRAELESAASQHGCPAAEVWVGEEDDAWTTVMYDNPRLLQGAIKSGYLAEHVTDEDVRQSVTRNSETFLAALYTDYKPRAGGQLDRERRRAELLAAGELLRSSATGEGDGENYRVRVTFANDTDGTSRDYLMSRETYQSIGLGEVATVADYRAHGDVTEADAS